MKTRKRKNPIHKQRDLFGGETSVSREGKISAGSVPLDLSEDEFADLKETDEDLWQRIWDNNEPAREKFKQYFKGQEEWEAEYYKDGDGAGHCFETLHTDLGAMDTNTIWRENDEDLDELQRVLVEETGLADDFIHDQMMEHVNDTEAYDERTAEGDEYYAPHGSTVALHVGETERQIDALKYEVGLAEIVERLSDAELSSVVVESDLDNLFVGRGLRNQDHWAAVQRIRRGDPDAALGAMARETLEKDGVTITVSVDVWVYLTLDADKLRAIILEAIEPYLEGTKKLPKTVRGPETDNVVYRFPDGFYVADLPAPALKAEGRELGTCVGSHGYPERVRAGSTKIYSLRTPQGRPKFTLEADQGGGVRQVKGKGNRLPGFDLGGGGSFKEEEVKKLVAFIEHLGIDPAKVNDMAPAMRALEGKKTNPFPKPKYHCGFCKERP